MKTIKTDVLVIGGGGAGFRAAIGAREKGVKALMVSKGPLARCGATPMAGADYTLDGNSMSKIEGLAGDPNDSEEKVFNDIVTQGYYLNNQKLVEQYIKRAPQCLKELMDWGLKVKLSDERMIFTSGIGMMNVLLRKARSVGVDLVENVAVLELLTSDNVVSGALGLDVKTGEFVVFRCKAVIMATGGWHKAFWPNTGMRDLSGEGMAMAHRAGVDLGNMEFITFCCNTFYSPPMWRGSIAPYILSMVCGGRLTNNRGEDVLEGYDPLLVEKGTLTEWNKSFLSYVTAKQAREGKAFENGGLHYTRGEAPWEFMEMVATMLFPNWRYKAMDLTEWGRMLKNNEPVEVGHAVEFFEGGIVINDQFETGVAGLFAAGECALGTFGANRVFAAITEIFTQGAEAGGNAGQYAQDQALADIDPGALSELKEKALLPLTVSNGESPVELRKSIQEKSQRCLGPIRNRDELETFLSYLVEIKSSTLPMLSTTKNNRTYNKEWMDALEVPNMVHLLEASVRSALMRTESRGVHYREDFPDTDNDNWLQEIVVKHHKTGLQLEPRPLTITRMSPPAGVTPYLDFMKRMMAAHSDTGGKH
ncbi:MAG: FAD-binding protein [Proteobacteria bacterium]|nr:FAD-binding protein [Pseudomonadota bacterium]